MPPSQTRSATDRLGERLRSSQTAADLQLLQTLRAEYARPLGIAHARLRDLGISDAASRVKTDDTIIAKLRRLKTRLSTMQDIGGIRIWRDMRPSDQTALSQRVAAAFPGARIDDLRNAPHFGYRAVHIVATLDGFPIEIQIRTLLQQLWAEAMEKMSDALGRDIKYGVVPPLRNDTGDPIPADFNPVHKLVRLSDIVRSLEASDDQRARFASVTGDAVSKDLAAHGFFASLDDANGTIRAIVEDLLTRIAAEYAAVDSSR